MTENSLSLPEGIVISFETDFDSLSKSDFEQAESIADAIIKHTKDTKDPYPALEILGKMERLKNITAITKAKVLYFLNEFWYEYQIDAPFLETIQAYIGITNPTVIRRYIKIWEMFEKNLIPERVQDDVRQMPLRDLTPVMGAVNQGYDINDEQWDKLINADSYLEVARIVREDIKNEEPRSQTILYRLDKRDGSLYAINQGNHYRIGQLVMETNNKVVRDAILRLVNKLGIVLYDLEEKDGV